MKEKKLPMKIFGEVGSQRAPKDKDINVSFGPFYNRTLSMKNIKVKPQVNDVVTLVKKEEVSEGGFKFSVYTDKGCILPTKGFGPRFKATLLEKVRLDDDFSEVKMEFYPTIKRLMDVPMNWGVEFTFRGLSTFIPYLMEWTGHILDRYKQKLEEADIYGLVGISQFPYNYHKDVWKAFCEQWGPLTNTLHHGGGEVGISLNDLKQIGGLPILGERYEEYLPPNEQLYSDKYPFTVIELLKIHAEICRYEGTQEVSWYKWIRHFYRGKQEFTAYGEAPPSSRKRKSTPASSSKEITKKPLPLHISDEGELAAFLALLLSRFVLPYGSNSIRPETFVMASIMSQGRKVSLAPTVLGHIYHGLGKVATYPGNPGSAKPNFGIHFVIGWLAEYFPCFYSSRPDSDFRDRFPLLAKYAGVNGHAISLYQARIILRGVEHISYRPISFGTIVGGIDCVDSDELSDLHFEHLLSIRSAVLPIRFGATLMLEPYYPNRFARQFGFDQGVPANDLKFDFSKRSRRSLEDIATAYSRLFKKNTGVLFHIPLDYHQGTYTYAYCSWWARVSTPYLAQSCNKVKSILLQQNCVEREPIFVIESSRTVTTGLQGAVRVSHVSGSRVDSPPSTESSRQFDIGTSSIKKTDTGIEPTIQVEDFPSRVSLSDDINPKRVRRNQPEKSDSSHSVGFQDLLIYDNSANVDDVDSREEAPIFANVTNPDSTAIVAIPELLSLVSGQETQEILPLRSIPATLQDLLSSVQQVWIRQSISNGVASVIDSISVLHSPEELLTERSHILQDLKTLEAIAAVNFINLSWLVLKVQDLFSDVEAATNLASGVDFECVETLTVQLAQHSSELESKQTQFPLLSDKSLALAEREKELLTLKEKVREMELNLEADKVKLETESIELQDFILEKENKIHQLRDELDQAGHARIEEVELKKQHIHALVNEIKAFASSH